MANSLVIKNPTLGKTLELLQAFGSIKLRNSDVEVFVGVLEAVGIEFTTEVDSVNELTRFTLKQK